MCILVLGKKIKLGLRYNSFVGDRSGLYPFGEIIHRHHHMLSPSSAIAIQDMSVPIRDLAFLGTATVCISSFILRDVELYSWQVNHAW